MRCSVERNIPNICLICLNNSNMVYRVLSIYLEKLKETCSAV